MFVIFNSISIMKGEKSFSDIQKLREFGTNKPSLKA